MENSNTEAPQDLTQEEKIQMMKLTFETIDFNEQAVFANWCHEQMEKNSGEILKEKVSEVNAKLNNFLAKATDKIINTGQKIYNKTNETYKQITHREEDVNPNSSKGNDIF